MKKIIAIVLCLCLTVSFSALFASAADTSGTCGENLTWVYDESTATLTVSGTGEMDFSGDSPWSVYRETIQTAVIGNGVTNIEDRAFFGCKALTSVTIPEGVTSIGGNAFALCDKLPRVVIPDSVTNIGIAAFYSCPGLTSVTIGNSVENIGEWAFQAAASLTSLSIPASVRSIGALAFAFCTSLTAFTVDENNPNFSSDASGVLYNKEKTELIQYPVGNTRSTFVVPESVTSIGVFSFDGCAGLTRVTIPNSVKSIGKDAFSDTGLTSVTLPDSITSITAYVFSGCHDLMSVTIPDSVKRVEEAAFLGCKALKDVYYTGDQEQWNQITIKERNDPLKSATVHYNCKEAVVRSVSVSDMTIKYKETAALTVEITSDPDAETTVWYESSDPKVVKVNDKGEITGAKRGKAIVTVTVTDKSGNTVTDSCVVTVKYTCCQWLIMILLFGWIWY